MKSQTPYQKIASYEAKTVKKCVLLYSGGLDTSVMLKWIQDAYDCEMIALAIDLGQQTENLKEAKEKALKLGAKKVYILDCKDEFAENYLTKAIKANASYQGDYHLSCPLGRPLLAEKAVEIAKKEGADAIAHGCTGKGNDQVRIEASALCLNPDIKIIAPVREWSMGRKEEIAYAKKHGIPVKQSSTLPYSWDDNMWGICCGGGELEDPKKEPPIEKILQLCTTPEQAPNKKIIINIDFEKGIPTKLNGEKLKLTHIISELNIIGAKHAIGYTIQTEDRLIGLKVRELYENPAAHIIITAHRELEKFVSTQQENEWKALMDTKWAYLCYSAKWFEPTMKHLNAAIDSMNEKVTGTVTLSLYKGKLDILAVESLYSLFDLDLATSHVANAKFNQNCGAPFTEIYSLAMKMAHQASCHTLSS